jgi:serine protease DegQ
MGINGTTMRASAHEKRPAGVEVVAVAPRSAAAVAGIATGDEITSIDDLAVSSITALQGRLYTDPPGTVVFVGVVDRGRAHTVAVTLAGSHG